MCRSLAEKSLERLERLLKGAAAVAHNVEVAGVARRVSRVLRDAGVDRTILGGCVWVSNMLNSSQIFCFESYYI